MNLPVWPEYYRNRAEEYQNSRIIFAALFAVGIILEMLMLVFKWDYCLILGFCLIAFAICGWIQCAWERKNVLLEINLEETQIAVLDHYGKRIRTAEYNSISNLEVREIQLLEKPKGSRFQGEPVRCKLIFLYLDSATYFRDLKLPLNAPIDGKELFFHSQCIALDYNDEAWDFLTEKSKEYMELEQT